MSNIAVERCRDHNNIGVDLVGLEVLRYVDTISQGVRCSDQHETSNAILFARHRQGLVVLVTKMVLRFSKIIITSKIPVWSKGFFGNLEKMPCQDSIGTIDVSNKLNAFLLLLEFKQAINDVVSAWRRVAKKKDTNLSSKSLSSETCESLVECKDGHVGCIVPSTVGNHLWLDLHEVSAHLAIVGARELLSDLQGDQLTIWLVLSDGRQPVLAVLEDIWYDDRLSDSASAEKTQGRALFEIGCTSFVLLLILFLLLSGGEEGFNIWIAYHVVGRSGSGAFELDWSWRLVAVEVAPFLSDLFEALEHGTVELDECFGDDWLVFSFSSLQTHHGWQRTACSNPFGGIRISKILDARHVA